MTTTLDDALAATGRFIREAERLDETTLDRDDLARWMRALDGVKRRIKLPYESAEKALVKLVGRNERLVIDGAVFEQDRSSGRKGWDNERVRHLVVSTALFDPATGEARDAESAVRVLGELYALGGSGLRVTAAARLIPGFDADEYSESNGKTTIKVTEATAEAQGKGGAA